MGSYTGSPSEKELKSEFCRIVPKEIIMKNIQSFLIKYTKKGNHPFPKLYDSVPLTQTVPAHYMQLFIMIRASAVHSRTKMLT